MLRLPPPAWALIYVLIATALSYLAGWPLIPGLPLVPLAVLLVVAGVALSATGGVLFRREGTELNPASTTNRKLVTRGPFRFTRNPMYLGLVSPGRVGRASLAYWRLPERLYDDPDELAVWAGRSLAIAERKTFPPRGRAKRKR